MSEPLNARSDRVAKRSQYTGESARTVRQQLKADSGPLMPVPTSHDQLELEAAVLLAWKRVVARRYGLPFGTGGASPLTQVRAATDMLTLEIDHHRLHEFLAESLPMLKNGQVAGIPGLRPRPGRTHLDLVLIGPQGRTNAVVRLRSITRERWRAAERYIDQSGASLWRYGLTDLHPDEVAALRHRAPQPAALMSAVLRRLPMWREATWLEAQADEVTLRLYWRGGPEDTQVAQMLEDPLCGIANVTVVSRRLPNALRGVALAAAEAPSPVRAQLRTLLAVAAPREASVWSRDPAPIPIEVWDQQEMRDALARREISSVYRLLRRHGVSQRQIAALTGQSQSEVSEILKGRQVMAYDVLTRITVGLGVPRGYMGLAYDETTAVRVAEAVNSPRQEDESVRRRKFLAHVAAAMSVDSTEAPSRFWVSPSPVPESIGMTDVRQIEAATRALRALELQYGGGSSRDAAATHLASAEKLLDATATDLVKERLESAITDLRTLAG